MSIGDTIGRFFQRAIGAEAPRVVTKTIQVETDDWTPGHIMPWLLVTGGVILLTMRGKNGSKK